METASAALSEIMRVGAWALRALGFSYGVAERGSVLLGVAEALDKGALRSLRVDEDKIARAASLGACRRRNAGPGRWEIAAAGKSLIEIGLPAVDLAAATPDHVGWAHVGISGVIDPDLLGAVFAVAATAGTAAIGIVSDPAAGRDGDPHWNAGVQFGSDTVVCEGSGDGSSAQLAELAASLGLFLSEGSVPPWRTAPETRIDLFVRSGMAGPVALPDGVVATNASAAVRSAYARGIVVPKADLDHLYALERRSWAPSSERSRAQAGFQAK